MRILVKGVQCLRLNIARKIYELGLLVKNHVAYAVSSINSIYDILFNNVVTWFERIISTYITIYSMGKI